MRIVTPAFFVAAVCAVAFAAPGDRPGGVPANDGKPITPVLMFDEREIWRPGPPLFFDGDRDGFDNVVDCNDDAYGVNPAAIETANGLDDDCDGVVDDGFDTTADLPESQVSLAIFPQLAIPGSPDLISTETRPRVMWNANDKVFIAVWVDLGDRLRVARIDPEGAPIGDDITPPVIQKQVRRPDAVWTGTRLGIVYEDISTSPAAVRLMTLDSELRVISESVVATKGAEPKIAWGQDRFGVVWNVPGEPNSVRFQRLDRGGGLIAGDPEPLANSGRSAAIAFSGGGVDATKEGGGVHEGAFGIVFDAYYGFAQTGDVILASRPRDPALGSPAWVRVNEHDKDPYTKIGALPGIAANTSGFAVCWHVLEDDANDRASMRFFSLDKLVPVQEFAPDADAGRYGRMAWTGSEFVMVNDNGVDLPATGYDVHFRRVDPSGNTHLAAGWGPWTELNLSKAVAGGVVSTHPDIAPTGQSFGVVWIEQDAFAGGGRLWFAKVTHK